MREVKLDTSMVVTYKLLMTSVKVQTLVILTVQNKQVLTGEDSGHVNHVDGASARTNALQKLC